MEESQGDIPLEIGITHTIDVSTATRTTEEDMTPSHIIAVSSSGDKNHLSPPPGLRADQYTLIRLSKVEDREMLETLDAKIGTVNEVPNIEELSDGSWEICILKSHRHSVQDKLGKMFPGSEVDLYYDPLEPTATDLKFWDYDTAKKLRQYWFSQRAIRVAQSGWPAAATFYAYFLKDRIRLKPHRQELRSQDVYNGPVYFGAPHPLNFGTYGSCEPIDAELLVLSRKPPDLGDSVYQSTELIRKLSVDKLPKIHICDSELREVF
jgi:hypothetical protein